MNDKRAAVRLLQSIPFPEAEPGSCGSISGSTTPNNTAPPVAPDIPSPSSARRRMPCSPGLSGDSFAGVPGSPRNNASSLARSASLVGAPPPSGDFQPAPDAHQLSLPLTLLSLHNGGRHNGRTYAPGSLNPADASPMRGSTCGSVGCLSREGSVTLPATLAGANLESSAQPLGSTAQPPQAGPQQQPQCCQQATGLPHSTSLWCTTTPSPGASAQGPGSKPQLHLSPSSPSLGTADNRPALPARNPAAPSSGGLGTLSSPSPPGSGNASPAAPSSPSLGPYSPSSPGPGITLPSHLCSHRPPTPLCKDEDLMNSLRHMSSPNRRRASRFAGTASTCADAALLAAAQAAVAADEAGLLDSSSPSLSMSGGGMGPRLGLSMRSGDVSGCTADLRARRGVVGDAPGSPGLLLGAMGVEAAPWSSPVRSTSRRCSTQLVTVPEEPEKFSRGDAFPAAAPSPTGVTPLAGRRRPGAGAAVASNLGPDSPSAAAVAPEDARLAAPADDSLSSFMTSLGQQQQQQPAAGPGTAAAADTARVALTPRMLASGAR